mmetsp:Transcript_21147/g.59151  ORF Transcript_21147/g.59151 Transcript_21147/m.59151 type:complete len:1079 (-) Transcript_21147:12-3248(-)
MRSAHPGTWDVAGVVPGWQQGWNQNWQQGWQQSSWQQGWHQPLPPPPPPPPPVGRSDEQSSRKRPRMHEDDNSALDDGFADFPSLGRLGGEDWVSTVLAREPPCLGLQGLQPSESRVKRVKSLDSDSGFQRNGSRMAPARHLVEELFRKMLDGVRFPPNLLEFAWRAEPPDAAKALEDSQGSSAQPCRFRLLNNLADLPAQQPPHFKRHQLRPEQLRSLAWMLAREGYEDGDGKDEVVDVANAAGEQEPFVAEWRQMHACSRASISVDLRVKASYLVRGGILADRVGFGKTATTIGLIDATQHLPAPEVPPPDCGSFIPAKGTLVIVPSNLLDQWAQEISKFVWDGSRLAALNSGWRAGRSKDGCPLKVLVIGTVSPLRLLPAGELAEADVVLCSYRLLFSKIYQDRREDLAGDTSLTSLVLATRKLIEGSFRMSVGDKSKVHTSKTLVFPMLEMFYWRRVVFDEFHELESFQSAQQSILQHMRAHSRWGLTGTPPIDNIAGVIFMSSLFRCDLPGFLPMEKVQSKKGMKRLVEVPNMLYYESDKLMQELAGRFLDRFARQNTAELPHIVLQQHVIMVRHNAAEQALYLGEAHDAPELNWDVTGALTEGKAKAFERLLKLCSHFGGALGSTPEAECERIREQKFRRRTQEKRTMARCCRVLQTLVEKVRDSANAASAAPATDTSWRAELHAMESSLKAQGRPAVHELAEEELAAEHENTQERCALLAGHRPRDEALARVLAKCVDGEAGVGSLRHWEAFLLLPLSAREAEKLLAGQVKEQAENLLSFCAAVASQEYFDSVTKALVSWPPHRACYACSDRNVALSRLVITPCAHAFCIDCLRKCVEAHGVCCYCRQPVQPSDVRPLLEEVSSSREDVHGVVESYEESTDPRDMIRHTSYGTKLVVLLRKLQELRQRDTTAKAILFVQFDDLKMQVAAALREGGVPTAQLRGSVSQRAAIIRDWQENPDSRTFVLLLSLAESASGTNLTAGSHIIFLHPMLASTAERAAAQELQAIGRARRHGQQRASLHVWRFVTTGTFEQVVTRRHQATLQAHEATCQARAGLTPQGTGHRSATSAVI